MKTHHVAGSGGLAPTEGRGRQGNGRPMAGGAQACAGGSLLSGPVAPLNVNRETNFRASSADRETARWV